MSLDLPVIGSKGHDFRTITEPTELPNPHAPELGLGVGVRLKGDLHRGASTLADDALGFGPRT